MPSSVGLAWYSTGTVQVTQGSTAVVGVSTNWRNAELLQAYAGTSGNTLNYYVIRNFAATLQSELAAQVSQLVGDYEAWKDGRVNEIAIPFNFSSLYKGTWATGRSYKALDIVLYNKALYVSAVAHTSASGNTPGTSGAATYWLSYAPAVPASIDILNYHNAGTHNALYRGKNLGSSLTAAQSAAIRAGTFDDIYVGDYWSFSNISYTYLDENDVEQSATYSGVMRVADCDYYLQTGDSNVLRTHHIVVVPDLNMFPGHMNETKTTEGGYVGSNMRTKLLRRAEAIFKACFGTDHVLSYRELLVNAVSNGKPSGATWFDACVELMDERMVYGSCIYDSGNPDGTTIPNRYSVSCKQLNLFQHRPDFIIPQRQWSWLRNIVSTTEFAIIGGNGHCCYYQAMYDGGTRPFALIY